MILAVTVEKAFYEDDFHFGYRAIGFSIFLP